ncbi:MAG: DNA-binding response regulator [Anaerolineae bacterium]|nr:MAG: DNA-binding response regulator [Anaerolineae bacterium]
MMNVESGSPRRVLIASANPLFREGLRKRYAARWGEKAEIVGLPSTIEETLHALEELHPDLVIVDYDDETINREEFLNRFVTSESPMQVVLVSLQTPELVMIYDRRRLTPAQADEWLASLWDAADEEP